MMVYVWFLKAKVLSLTVGFHILLFPQFEWEEILSFIRWCYFQILFSTDKIDELKQDFSLHNQKLFLNHKIFQNVLYA